MVVKDVKTGWNMMFWIFLIIIKLIILNNEITNIDDNKKNDRNSQIGIWINLEMRKSWIASEMKRNFWNTNPKFGFENIRWIVEKKKKKVLSQI